MRKYQIWKLINGKASPHNTEALDFEEVMKRCNELNTNSTILYYPHRIKFLDPS